MKLPALPSGLLTEGELIAGLTTMAQTPWGDILSAARAKFADPTKDLVALEDIAVLLAAFGVPYAGLAADAIPLLIAISQAGGLKVIAPWDPNYVTPNANHDPLSRGGRR